jgi:signal transduction histidine kinase
VPDISLFSRQIKIGILQPGYYMYLNRLLIRFLFMLLVSFNGFKTFAQTDTGNILTKWQKARLHKGYNADTGSVILLNQLSEQYLYNHADSALYFAKQALKLATAQKYISGQALSWNNIGKTYYVLGDYTSSLDAAAKLMSLSNKINYQQGRAGAYQITGLIYLAQNKNDEAISTFGKALKIFIQLKDHAREGKVYFDIGICYDESGRSEKAFYYLDKALEIANRFNDHVLVSMVLNRKGETYFHLKDYSRALSFYQQVISSKATSNWEKGFAYSGLAQTQYQLGQYDKAIVNVQKSLAVAGKVKSQADAIRALTILSESYAAVKDYKHAYGYQVKLKKANDSLFNSEKEKEINYLHLKQQQADNIRLQNEIKAKEQTILFAERLFIFRNLVAACVIVFIIIIIRNNKQKTELNKVLQQQNVDIALQKEEISKQKEELHEINLTKDRLFSVISHDLRSPFTAILQTMDLIRSGDIPGEERDTILEDFYQQVNLVAFMVNNLLFWANSQQSGIKSHVIRLNITDAVNGIVSVSKFLAKHKNINIYHRCKGEKWVHADLDHVKIILQNLIGNAIKFTPKGGTVEIYYTEEESYEVIHIKDTGVGISPEKMDKLFKVTGKEISGYGTNNEPGAGIGLMLIKQFVDANDGRLEVRSKPGEGTEFTVYFRKEPFLSPEF